MKQILPKSSTFVTLLEATLIAITKFVFANITTVHYETSNL